MYYCMVELVVYGSSAPWDLYLTLHLNTRFLMCYQTPDTMLCPGLPRCGHKVIRGEQSGGSLFEWSVKSQATWTGPPPPTYWPLVDVVWVVVSCCRPHLDIPWGSTRAPTYAPVGGGSNRQGYVYRPCADRVMWPPFGDHQLHRFILEIYTIVTTETINHDKPITQIQFSIDKY